MSKDLTFRENNTSRRRKPPRAKRSKPLALTAEDEVNLEVEAYATRVPRNKRKSVKEKQNNQKNVKKAPNQPPPPQAVSISSSLPLISSEIPSPPLSVSGAKLSPELLPPPRKNAVVPPDKPPFSTILSSEEDEDDEVDEHSFHFTEKKQAKRKRKPPKGREGGGGGRGTKRDLNDSKKIVKKMKEEEEEEKEKVVKKLKMEESDEDDSKFQKVIDYISDVGKVDRQPRTYLQTALKQCCEAVLKRIGKDETLYFPKTKQNIDLISLKKEEKRLVNILNNVEENVKSIKCVPIDSLLNEHQKILDVVCMEKTSEIEDRTQCGLYLKSLSQTTKDLTSFQLSVMSFFEKVAGTLRETAFKDFGDYEDPRSAVNNLLNST